MYPKLDAWDMHGYMFLASLLEEELEREHLNLIFNLKNSIV
jgi:hypothetical protein